MPREWDSKAVEVKFAQLGGTPFMSRRPGGGLEGSGNLDDIELKRLERALGLDRVTSARESVVLERELAQILHTRFQTISPQDLDSGQHFAKWCPGFHQNVKGLFLPLFNADSSHFRAAIVAPMVYCLLNQAIKDPNIPIIGAEGTDTADIGPLMLLDTLVFDTHLPPFTFSGSDRPFNAPSSDAPMNFQGLSKLARLDLRWYLQYPKGDAKSGVFWYYHNVLYQIADLVKFSPQEIRRLEGKRTFFSPNIRTVLASSLSDTEENPDWQYLECQKPPQQHISRRISMLDLYNAMMGIYTVDLGSQNPVGIEIEQVLNPQHKAIIVAAHGLGNVSDPIKWACVEAARAGKIVIDTSRCLVGTVDERYSSSLLAANNQEGELLNEGVFVISGRRLNKAAARAIATRAVLEAADQQQAQALVESYYNHRFEKSVIEHLFMVGLNET